MTTAVIEKGTALPFLAHLYSNQLVFKKSLGRLLNSPPIVSAYGSVGSPVSLLLPAADSSASAPVQGDIVKLTKQGPAASSDGGVLYTGIIDDLPDDYDATVKHEISLLPIGSELGTAGFSNNYTTLTDVAQMIRDAVSVTAHCTATTSTVPNTGITAIFDFSNTSPLRVLEEAKKILGPQWTWICDEIGQVWLVNVNQAAAATYSARRGVDYVSRKYTSKITDLKNFIVAIGGFPTGSALPISAVFDDGTLKTGWPPPIWTHAQLSQYGLRALTPPLIYDRVSDQATLTAIVSTVGQQLDRRMTKVVVKLINYPVRINLARLAGATMRYIEPATADGGSGVFSPNYVILDVTVNGNVQTLTLSDMPVTIDDLKYEIDRMLQDVQYAASTSIGAGTPNVVTPGMLAGAVAGGPAAPTVPAFTGTPTTTALDNTAQTNAAYIMVNWGANPANENVVAYELRYHKVGDSNYSYVRTSDLTVKVAGLIPGVNYGFALRSINNIGVKSAFNSEVTRVAAAKVVADAVPTGLTLVPMVQGIGFFFNGNTEQDIQGYEVQASIGGAAYVQIGGVSLETLGVITPNPVPAPGTSVAVQVRSVDWSGNRSAWSTAVTANIGSVGGQNLVPNASFEDPNITTYFQSNAVVPSSDTTQFLSGARSLKILLNTTGDGYVAIPLYASPLAGKKVILSFWAKADVACTLATSSGVTAGNWLQENGGGYRGICLSPVGLALTTNWQRFVYVDTAPSDWIAGSRVVLRGGWAAGAPVAVYYDDISVQIGDLSTTFMQSDMVVDRLLAGSLKVFAGIIAGGGIGTGTSGARALMDSGGFHAYDGTATVYATGLGAGETVRIDNAGNAYFKGTIAATTLISGAIQSTSAVQVPAIPGSFTGFQLDPTNGLRFFNAGTLTAQFTPTSAIIYGGTIAGGHIYLTAGSQIIETANGIGSTQNGVRLWQGSSTFGQLDVWGGELDFYLSSGTVPELRLLAINNTMQMLCANNAILQVRYGINDPTAMWVFEPITANDGNGASASYWGLRGYNEPNLHSRTADLFDADGYGVWRQSGFSVPGVGSGAGCDIGFPRRFVNAPTGITQVVAAESMSGAAMGVSDISRFGFNNYINYPSGTGNRYTHRYYNPTGGS